MPAGPNMIKITSNTGPLATLLQMNEMAYHDVVLVCNNDETVTSSRLVLASASKVLKLIMEDCFEDEQINISFVGYEKKIVEQFVLLISHGHCRVKDINQLEDVQALAKTFEVESHDQSVRSRSTEVKSEPMLDPSEENSIHEINTSIVESPKENTDSEDNIDFEFVDSVAKDVLTHSADVEYRGEKSKKAPTDNTTSDSPGEVGTRSAHESRSKKSKSKRDYGAKRTFKCTYCDHKTRGEFNLMVHMKIHIGDDAVRCKVCKKILKNSNHWHEHRAILHKVGNDGGVCNVCGKVMASERNLQRHKELMHEMKELPFCCEVCGKQFKTKGNWKRHQSVHETSRNYICDVCGHGSKDAHSLRFHKLTHVADKPFKCELCAKSFSYQYKLDDHRKSHSDERSFQCSLCSKAFKTKVTLAVHVNMRHGSDKYNCGICGKAFKDRVATERHAIIHSEFKPFVCGQCGLSFNHYEVTRRHCKAYHFEKPQVQFTMTPELSEFLKSTVIKIIVSKADEASL